VPFAIAVLPNVDAEPAEMFVAECISVFDVADYIRSAGGYLKFLVIGIDFRRPNGQVEFPQLGTVRGTSSKWLSGAAVDAKFLDPCWSLAVIYKMVIAQPG
jgi:hypothetical protein